MEETKQQEYIPQSRASKALFMKALMDSNPTAVTAFMLAGAFFGFILGVVVGLML